MEEGGRWSDKGEIVSKIRWCYTGTAPLAVPAPDESLILTEEFSF